MFKRLLKNELARLIVLSVLSLVVFVAAVFLVAQINNTIDKNLSPNVLVETIIIFIAFISFVVFSYMAVMIPMTLKEKNEQKKALKIIKENLSADFKVVYLKKERISKLSCLLLEHSGETLFLANINSNDEVHLIIGKSHYADEISDYKWFVNNFSFNKT